MEGKKPGEPTDVGHHLCSRAWSKGTCGVERLEHERRYLEVASAFQVLVRPLQSGGSWSTEKWLHGVCGRERQLYRGRVERARGVQAPLRQATADEALLQVRGQLGCCHSREG